jgi:hypothetical protein
MNNTAAAVHRELTDKIGLRDYFKETPVQLVIRLNTPGFCEIHLSSYCLPSAAAVEIQVLSMSNWQQAAATVPHRSAIDSRPMIGQYYSALESFDQRLQES